MKNDEHFHQLVDRLGSIELPWIQKSTNLFNMIRVSDLKAKAKLNANQQIAKIQQELLLEDSIEPKQVKHYFSKVHLLKKLLKSDKRSRENNSNGKVRTKHSSNLTEIMVVKNQQTIQSIRRNLLPLQFPPDSKSIEPASVRHLQLSKFFPNKGFLNDESKETIQFNPTRTRRLPKINQCTSTKLHESISQINFSGFLSDVRPNHENLDTILEKNRSVPKARHIKQYSESTFMLGKEWPNHQSIRHKKQKTLLDDVLVDLEQERTGNCLDMVQLQRVLQARNIHIQQSIESWCRKR